MKKVAHTHRRRSNLSTKMFVPFSSAQSCPTLCNPIDCSFPVHHHLPELAQTHVHWVSDAIQPSHPLSSPSPALKSFLASGSFPMSQLFASGGLSTGVSASTSGCSWKGLLFLRQSLHEESQNKFKFGSSRKSFLGKALFTSSASSSWSQFLSVNSFSAILLAIFLNLKVKRLEVVSFCCC